MDRVRRFTGMAKGVSAAPVQRDEDESLILFGEMYKHDKEMDVNLLEPPMFSVEFEAIHGEGRMYKLPSGRHDYDWLKTPPATPLFPSLEMEANSSQMIFQKELPVPHPVRTSRFSSKPDAAVASTSTSARSESPTSGSSKSVVTPSERPGSSSKRSLNKGAPPPSKEDSAYRIDKRSSYTPLTLTNRQRNAVPVPRTTASATKTSKRTSGDKSQPPNAVKSAAKPDNKAPMNIAATTAPKARSNCSSAGAKDRKTDADGRARRLSCTPAPAATMGSNSNSNSNSNGEVLDTVAAKGRSRDSSSTNVVPPVHKGGGSTEAVAKGRRRAAGEKEQIRLKLGSHAKK